MRKDSLYCDRADSPRRRAARTVLDRLFDCLTAWLAPILCFTAEEAWLARHAGDDESVHLRLFPVVPESWRDDALAARWRSVREVRRVVTGALELDRAAKRIGSSLEARVEVFVGETVARILNGVDLAEVAITSGLDLRTGSTPEGAFTLADVPEVAVVARRAAGAKCERCWKVLEEVGGDPEHAGTCRRCADAVRHHRARA